MTLRELLGELDPVEKVYIGADDGCGFTAIGRIRELELDAVDRLRLKELEQKARKFKILADSRRASIRKYRRDIAEKGASPQRAQLLADAEEYARRYDEMYARVKARRSAYQPLAGRAVTETYPKLLEPATVIIVRGREEGFWFEEEFNGWQRRWS